MQFNKVDFVLKIESCHAKNFIDVDGTGGCRDDILPWWQWLAIYSIPIFFRVTPLPLEQSHDGPSANETIRKNFGKCMQFIR